MNGNGINGQFCSNRGVGVHTAKIRMVLIASLSVSVKPMIAVDVLQMGWVVLFGFP